jgi:hypothetical protein
MSARSLPGRSLALLSLFLVLPAPALLAQGTLIPSFDPDREPLLLRDLTPGRDGGNPLVDWGSSKGRPRIRLFRMPAGFLSEPVGLDNDPDVAPPPDALPSSLSGPDDDFFNRMQVTVGTDNPFFDFRSTTDPGGVGYYRLHSQLQILETGSTGLALECQAVTPAGLESDGLADGPTFFSPALAWYQELGADTAIQGFVGKNIRANARWVDNMNRSVKYGMAVQRPVPGLTTESGQGLFVFVEALGRYRPENDPTSRNPNGMRWDLLPGLHWRLSDNWWLSGGVVLPMGMPRQDANFWQITCSWRF